VCDITWKTYTRERLDPDQPYDVIVKVYHTWPARGCTYVVLVGFSPAGLFIGISATLSDMSDNLFTAPLIVMHVSYET
jgi:hypothetical protein